MEQRLVYVVIVDCETEKVASINNSMKDWKIRVEGAYTAKVDIQEVNHK